MSQSSIVGTATRQRTEQSRVQNVLGVKNFGWMDVWGSEYRVTSSRSLKALATWGGGESPWLKAITEGDTGHVPSFVPWHLP